jgi:predicted nucleic acid-binding protein
VARVISPGEEHWRILKSLFDEVGTAGNLTTDAHLAALAIENGATLYSTDTDFQRFRHLRWVNPLRA